MAHDDALRDKPTLLAYINLLSDTKVQRGILVFVGMMDEMKLEAMTLLMEAHNTNVFFYMAYKTDTSTYRATEENKNYRLTWDQVSTNIVMPLFTCVLLNGYQ